MLPVIIIVAKYKLISIAILFSLSVVVGNRQSSFSQDTHEPIQQLPLPIYCLSQRIYLF